MWGLLHAVFLFWAVVFPFSYRSLKLSGRIRYTHIFCVVLAVIVPLPAALAHLKDGYVINFTPTLVCTGRSEDYNFYTVVLPLSIILYMCHVVFTGGHHMDYIQRKAVYGCFSEKYYCSLFSSIGVNLKEITSSKEGEKCWKS